MVTRLVRARNEKVWRRVGVRGKMRDREDCKILNWQGLVTSMSEEQLVQGLYEFDALLEMLEWSRISVYC